jgi:hypothetical protein
MNRSVERRALQACVAIACLVPFLAGGTGILRSAAMAKGVALPLPVDLDSHFRYLSGLLFGLGLVFAYCVPSIEKRGTLFRALTAIAFVGGLSRLLSLAQHGPPSFGHRFGLVMELGVVPLLMLWQWRVERRYASPAS